MIKLRYLSLLERLDRRRAYVVTLSSAPLAFLTPCFIVGQLLALLSDRWLIWLTLATIAVVVSAVLRAYVKSPLLHMGLLLGVVSGVSYQLTYPPLSTQELPVSGAALLKIVDQPRYSRVGEVTIVADMLSQRRGASGFDPPIRVLCSAKDLPWRELGARASELEVGAIVSAKVKISPLAKRGWRGDYDAYYRRMYRIQARCVIEQGAVMHLAPATLIGDLRNSIIHKVGSLGEGSENSGLLLSMGLGVRDVLSTRTTEAFQKTGLAHLLVLSGYQIGMVFISIRFILVQMLALLGMRGIISRTFNYYLAASVAGLIGVLVLAALTGWENASTRAVIAVLITTVALLQERPGGFLNSLCAALLVMAVIWPGVYLEAGVQLTFAALAGLLIGATCSNRNRLFKAIIATVYASLFSALVASYWFGEFVWVGIVLNIFLAPVLSVVGCYGLALVLLLSAIDTSIASLAMTVVGGVLVAVREWLVALARCDWLTIESAWIYYLSILGIAAWLLDQLSARYYRFLVLSGVNDRTH